MNRYAMRYLKVFKLFPVDVGLLDYMTDLKSVTLLSSNELFKEFKSALTEQYICSS